MTRGMRLNKTMVLVAAFALLAAPALAQVCEDISGQCLTTPLEECVDGVGNSVQVQIGGLGAEDGDSNGGTCGGDPATALLTFTKTSATQLRLTVANTSCVDSTITAAFWNMTTSVTGLTPILVSAVAPDVVDTTWMLGYSQTQADNDGFGYRADGFGNFDANVHNGNLNPNGGDPTEILDGETLNFDIGVAPGYNLCDILSEISTPPPGERNRNAVGRFQSCGVNGNSAFIGPCTPDDGLLAVISRFELSPGDGQMTVDWSTSLEIENAGFNVLRRERGQGWELVNPTFIPGAGDSVSGAEYRFVDNTARNGVDYQYRIEDIDFRGMNGLSGIRGAVANPQNPDVKLQSPAYGAPVALDRDLGFGFENVRGLRGSGMIQIAANPSFDGDVLEIPAPLRTGSQQVRPTRPNLSGIEGLAAGTDDGTLYWRVTDRAGNVVSDTFRMEVE